MSEDNKQIQKDLLDIQKDLLDIKKDLLDIKDFLGKNKDDKPEETFITTRELAKRWGKSHRTLENTRNSGFDRKGHYEGLKYVKAGGSIKYRLSDIIEYENSRLSKHIK